MWLHFKRRWRTGWRPFLAVLAGTIPLVAGAALGITLPSGFVAEPIPFVFDVPTAIAFLPDGRLLVAEKGGIVYVVQGSERHPLWVHEEEVLNTDDRGLLAIAVDPDFTLNRRLYFLYTVDPDSNGIEFDNYDDTFARLTRYEVSVSDPNTVDYSTRAVLIGRTWREGFASGSGTHTIAGLAWGRDRSLLVSAGDGAHHEQVDSGGLDSGLFAPDRTDSIEDIGAFRAQDLRSLDGKVLRVDPENGLGYPSNPYFDGDPASNRSRVWAYGLRNPFRIAMKPGTGSTNPTLGLPGTLYISDVGWITWEEVNVSRTPGRNFGWPCFEGQQGHPDYQAATPSHHGCSTLGTAENPALHTPPVVALNHKDAASSLPAGTFGGVIAGGVFYTGTSYPSPYRQRYFIGDYLRNWIKVVVTDDQDRLLTLFDFATQSDRPVCFATDPISGDLHYVAIQTGEVRRIRYTSSVDAGPVIASRGVSLSSLRPNPSRGPVTLTLGLPAPGHVELAVHDLAGREVWKAPGRDASAGRVELFWPGIKANGDPAEAGVYFARVRVGAVTLGRRFVLVP